VLKLPAEEINDSTALGLSQAWDSLRHLSLMLAIEDEFKIEIPDESVSFLISFPLIRDWLKTLE
jgi:acyl carrier protein